MKKPKQIIEFYEYQFIRELVQSGNRNYPLSARTVNEKKRFHAVLISKGLIDSRLQPTESAKRFAHLKYSEVNEYSD